MVDLFDFAYSNFLRYSGVSVMAAFMGAIREFLSTKTTGRDQAIEAIRTFVGYINCLSSWSFHYFPWNIGVHLTYGACSVGFIGKVSNLSHRLRVSNGRRVRLTWELLGISVITVFSTKENPKLCNDILEKLPCMVKQNHAMVSRESMYAWLLVVSNASFCVRELQCDAPIDSVRYSQGSGNKSVIHYGEVIEDIETPVLDEFLPDYCSELVKVDRAVWKRTFETKELITLPLTNYLKFEKHEYF